MSARMPSLAARLLLLVFVPAPILGRRVARSTAGIWDEKGDLRFTLPKHERIPELDVLFTSDFEQAGEFLRPMFNSSHYGMYIGRKMVTRDDGTWLRRASLVQVTNGKRVLIFDLLPNSDGSTREPSRSFVDFFQSPNHEFYGIGLLRSVSNMAFEYDCVARCVDFQIRSWPQTMFGRLNKMARRFLGIHITPPADWWSWEERPLSVFQLSSAAETAYLSWALAGHFIKRQGPPLEEWFLTLAELYGARPRFEALPKAESQHDWDSAMKKWDSLEVERSKRELQKMQDVHRWEQLSRNTLGTRPAQDIQIHYQARR